MDKRQVGRAIAFTVAVLSMGYLGMIALALFSYFLGQTTWLAISVVVSGVALLASYVWIKRTEER